jgi:hypothetical protein
VGAGEVGWVGDLEGRRVRREEMRGGHRQGLSLSRGLIGGWPDESELGARPSPLAPARAAGSAPPRSRFVPGDGGGGCGRSGQEAATHRPSGPESGRRGAPRTAPRPGTRTPPAPTRSHRPPGEHAAPRPQPPAPRTARAAAPPPPPPPPPPRRIADALQVGYVTVRAPLAPAPRPAWADRGGLGDRGGGGARVAGLGGSAGAAGVGGRPLVPRSVPKGRVGKCLP